MSRQELTAYLTDTYSVEGERLFSKYPSFLVFRHTGNRKWFAVIMDIPRKNLGLTGDGEISVVNLKCDTRLIGSFREEPGIFPGWHMNKAHWLTVALDGSVDGEKIRFLVDMSYELTKKMRKQMLPHFCSIAYENCGLSGTFSTSIYDLYLISSREFMTLLLSQIPHMSFLLPA